MSSPVVLDFLFDDENEDELWGHKLTPDVVRQVLDNPKRIGRNKNRHRATHLIIGSDNGGRVIYVLVEPTHDPVLWRPVTAWRP